VKETKSAPLGVWTALAGVLDEADFFIETLLEVIRHPELALVMRDALSRHNVFKLSVEETLSRLRLANKEEGWRIEEEVICALADTAPEWPDGPFSFRSLEIRWGEGHEGVLLTFNRHLDRIRRTYGDQLDIELGLLSATASLCLAAGDDTHHAGVRWVTFKIEDATYDNQRAVFGPKPLADVGLSFAWLFREYFERTDIYSWVAETTYPFLHMGGYSLFCPLDVEDSELVRVFPVLLSKGTDRGATAFRRQNFPDASKLLASVSLCTYMHDANDSPRCRDRI